MKTRVLWITSFRPFGVSGENDEIQIKFLKSLERVRNAEITLHVTQFGEKNVEETLKEFLLDKNTKLIFKERARPPNAKYSQTHIMGDGLSEFCENEFYDVLVWSTCDFEAPRNLIDVCCQNKKNSEYISCIMPQYHQTNRGHLFDSLAFNFGIDIFVLNISTETAQKMEQLVSRYSNVDWGCYEHFLSSMSDALNIKMINAAKRTNIRKYGNSYIDFGDTRSKQIVQWAANRDRLKDYLSSEGLSHNFADGSMYYLFWRNTRFVDLGIVHLVTFPSLMLKLAFSLFRHVYRKVIGVAG